jgi:hypothetical protein
MPMPCRRAARLDGFLFPDPFPQGIGILAEQLAAKPKRERKASGPLPGWLQQGPTGTVFRHPARRWQCAAARAILEQEQQQATQVSGIPIPYLLLLKSAEMLRPCLLLLGATAGVGGKAQIVRRPRSMAVWPMMMQSGWCSVV